MESTLPYNINETIDSNREKTFGGVGTMDCCSPNRVSIGGPFSEDDVMECDYEKNVTTLYEAIEQKSWDSVFKFLETEKWSSLHIRKDVQSPEQQTRTWVTRFDTSGEKIRWSQLPLHAAIIFGAPQKVVEKLVQIYPLSVRCTDDQRNLPLHLAFRDGAEDGIINLLIKSFPDAINEKNEDGSFPYSIASKNGRKDYLESVQKIVKHATRKVLSSHHQLSTEKTEALEETIKVQNDVVQLLEKEKAAFDAKLSEAKSLIEKLQERCEWLEQKVVDDKISSVTGKQDENEVPKNPNPHGGSSVVSSVALNSLISSFDRFDNVLNRGIETRADHETVDRSESPLEKPNRRKVRIPNQRSVTRSQSPGRQTFGRRNVQGGREGISTRELKARRSVRSNSKLYGSTNMLSEWNGMKVEKDHFLKPSKAIRWSGTPSSIADDSLEYSKDDIR